MIAHDDRSPPAALIALARDATGGEVSEAEHSGSRARFLAQRRERPSLAGLWALAAATLVVLVSGGVAVGLQGGDAILKELTQEATTSAPAASRTVAPSVTVTVPPVARSVAPLEEGKTSVVLAATPSSATFTIDDVPFPVNPVRATYPRDHATHRVRVEAPGYLPHTRQITFDTAGIVMDVALVKSEVF